MCSTTQTVPFLISDDDRKERKRIYQREYYHRNREKCRELRRQWKIRNIEYYYDYVDAYNHGRKINKKEWDKEHGKRKKDTERTEESRL